MAMDYDLVFNELYGYVKNILSGGAHGFDHVERVLKLGRMIALKEGADTQVVRFAALLHDIAREEEDRGEIEDHAEAGAEGAAELLGKYGMPEEFIKKVASCIMTHRFKNGITPQSLEGKVLSDADKLDAAGAVGIARAYLQGGRHGQKVWEDRVKDVRFESGMEGSDYSARTEYVLKLSKLKDKMFTKSGREMEQSRSEFMDGFFLELEKEIKGER